MRGWVAGPGRRTVSSEKWSQSSRSRWSQSLEDKDEQLQKGRETSRERQQRKCQDGKQVRSEELKTNGTYVVKGKVPSPSRTFSTGLRPCTHSHSCTAVALHRTTHVMPQAEGDSRRLFLAAVSSARWGDVHEALGARTEWSLLKDKSPSALSRSTARMVRFCSTSPTWKRRSPVRKQPSRSSAHRAE